jgi:serralysin
LLVGGIGNDTLLGGNGFDTLRGDAGADTITAGVLNDTYLYLAVSDSTTTAQDRITGYETIDLINVAALDV